MTVHGNPEWYSQVSDRKGSMTEVRVPKVQLLEQLKINRTQHHNIFTEALDGYRLRAIELLEEHIERIRRGTVEQVQIILPRPEDHTEDYDRAIDMLNWSLDVEVVLSANEFDTYVRDQWAWRRAFLTTNSAYSASAAAAAAASGR